jgi:hypothetical protein
MPIVLAAPLQQAAPCPLLNRIAAARASSSFQPTRICTFNSRCVVVCALARVLKLPCQPHTPEWIVIGSR